MTDNFNISQIQNTIGYTFKDKALIRTAFCHSSHSADGEESCERLVFLGRRLLDLVLSDYIYSRFPFTEEDELDRQLELYRSRGDFKSYIDSHGLKKYILLSETCESLNTDENIQFQIFLALCAAIYRDGGMPSLKGFIMPMVRSADNEARYTPKAYNVHSYEESDEQDNNAEYSERNTRGTKKYSRAGVAGRKSFIRDALAPVSLSPELKTTGNRKTAAKASDESDDNENYKSMLQEFVQKNIRTASVILKYNSISPSRGTVKTDVTLDGHLLASGIGDTKKAAERDAAKNAYQLITDRKSDLYIWFSSLSEDSITLPDRREDFVSKLNQYYQRMSRTSSAPIVYEKRDCAGRRQYCVAVLVEGKEIALGTAPTLKDAKQNAAEEACRRLGV